MTDKERTRRGIGNIKRFLIGEGLSLLPIEKDSDSVYLNIEDIKIRVSNHLPPVVGTEKINVVVTLDNPTKYMTVINGGILIHDKLKDLKKFLKSFLQLNKCYGFTMESMVEVKVKSKTKELQKVNRDLVKARSDLKKISSIIKGREESVGIDFSGLNSKQVNSIIKQIQSYKKQNK